MNGTAAIVRADARRLPLADASVDLIVTSPPYFGLRSYQDGGQHYAGQIGDEPTPAEFLDALIEVTRECVRVLKPSGSIFVNLGDKYAGGGMGGHSNGLVGTKPQGEGNTYPYRRAKADVPTKSLMLIPERFRIRCVDDIGLIARAVIIWSKPNGLESVTDRVRRSHEDWVHLTKLPRYYSAVDHIREEHVDQSAHAASRRDRTDSRLASVGAGQTSTQNPLGKLPGSVWTIPTEPLQVSDHLGVDHFAAFPTEWPRRIIQGWSPAGVCTACGEGRRSVGIDVSLDLTRPQARRAQALAEQAGLTEEHFEALLAVGVSDTGRGKATQTGSGKNSEWAKRMAHEAKVALGGYAREYLLRRPTGFAYRCRCVTSDAPTTPSIILDPFGGTGTTALVVKALGRHGISVDMSGDYCRLARWRCNDPKELAKAARKPFTASQPPMDGQGDLLSLLDEVTP